MILVQRWSKAILGAVSIVIALCLVDHFITHVFPDDRLRIAAGVVVGLIYTWGYADGAKDACAELDNVPQ